MDYRAVRGWKAVATLYHAYITGFVLTVATCAGAREAEDLWFAVFLRQHHDLFLTGLTKVGLDGLPDAVKGVECHKNSRPLTSEEYADAATLGWLVEWLQAFF